MQILWGSSLVRFCSNFPTIESRKEKIKGSCFICLSHGHSIKDCFSNRACFYCNAVKNHHRSLCPKRFGNNSKSTQNMHTNLFTNTVTNEDYQSGENRMTTVATLELNLLTTGETVMMQNMHRDNPPPTQLDHFNYCDLRKLHYLYDLCFLFTYYFE